MKKVLVIGIGAGDPDHVTMQAVNALNQVDVFFLLDKGEEKGDLTQVRKEICERFIRDQSYRMVEVPDPRRDPAAPYKAEVEVWRQKRAALFASLIRDELKDGEIGAFLVWGDPAIYDGTLLILQRILDEGAAAFDYEVIPGISAVQALAARHRVPLNRVGEAIQILPARKLPQALQSGVENLVVMLDPGTTLRNVDAGDMDIYWGAYLGTKDEVLIAGKLSAQRDTIERVRAEKRAEKGWIMDTYLLRRNPGA